MILKNCNSEEFIKRLNGREIICFGAGSIVREPQFLNVFNINNLENHISFFIDNDTNKHNTDFEFKGKNFKIYSPDVLKKINVNEYVLLITCASFVEIFTQLKNIVEIKNLECYFYTILTSFPDVNLDNFFKYEILKLSYKNLKEHLINLKLKDKHKGERCFIIGNGPSLNINDLDMLKNEITFAVNRIYLMFDRTDWRPTYYLCADQFLYKQDYKIIEDIDAKLKFTFSNNAVSIGKVYNDLVYLNRAQINNQKYNNFSYDIINGLCSSKGSSLNLVVQIAVYMGFSEIYLLGVDCSAKTEILPDGTIIHHDNIKHMHFSEKYEKNMQDLYDIGCPLYKVTQAWEIAKEACERVGVTIKNATRGGKLEVFERVDFDELMKNRV